MSLFGDSKSNYAPIDSILFSPSSSVAATVSSTNVKSVWNGLLGVDTNVNVDDQLHRLWRVSSLRYQRQVSDSDFTTGNSSDNMSRLSAPSDSTISVLLSSDHVEYRLATWLWIYVSPFLLVLGTVGNMMSLAVLRGCPSFRKSSVGFTLSALALVDTGVLCTSLLRQWLLYLTNWNFELRTAGGLVGCRLHFFLTYYLSQLSSWTVIVVTVERSLFVGLPILAKTICSRSRIMLLWSLIAVSLLVLNSHFFVIAKYPMTPGTIYSTSEDFPAADIDDGGANDEASAMTEFPVSASLLTELFSQSASGVLENQTENRTIGHDMFLSVPVDELVPVMCYISPEYDWYFTNVWYWIDFVVLSAVPFFVIFTGNCVICVCVLRAVHFRRQHQRRLTARGGGLISAASPTPTTGLCERQQTVNSEITSCGGSRDWKSSNDRYRATLTSSTLLLTSVSLAFLVTTAPNVVYFLNEKKWEQAAASEPDREVGARLEARIFLGFAVTNLLYYTNNSINFLLYCLTGTRFRRAARDLIMTRSKRPSTQSGAVQDLVPGGRRILHPVAVPTGSRNTTGVTNRRRAGESSVSAIDPTSPSAATAQIKPRFLLTPPAISINGVLKPMNDSENIEIN